LPAALEVVGHVDRLGFRRHAAGDLDPAQGFEAERLGLGFEFLPGFGLAEVEHILRGFPQAGQQHQVHFGNGAGGIDVGVDRQIGTAVAQGGVHIEGFDE